MGKWIGRIFLLGVIAFIAIGAYGYLELKASEPPSMRDAQWACQTYSQDGSMIPSRIYFAADVEIVDGKAVISNYWAKEGDKFRKQKGTKELPENTRILRR